MTQRMRAAIAVMLVAIASLVQPSAASAAVGPFTLEVTTPTTAQAGSPFNVAVRATNGGDAVSSWSISVSLPDGGTAKITSPAPFTSGQSYARVFVKGDRVFSFTLGQSIQASYPLAELYRQQTWEGGALRNLAVQIAPPQGATTVRLYIRVAVSDPLGTVVSFPQSSGEIDQQGLPALLRAVPMAQKGTATPAGTARPSTTPTFSPSPSLTPSPTASPTAQLATVTPSPEASPTEPMIVAPAETALPTPTRPVATATPPIGFLGRSAVLSLALTLATLLVIAGLVIAFAFWRSRRSPLPVATGIERAEAIPPPGGEALGRTPSGTRSLQLKGAPPPRPSATPAGRSESSSLVFQSFPSGLMPRGELRRDAIAVVYRAFQPSLDRDVALRMPRSDLTIDPGFAARFREEGRRMARLSHPNIITVYEVGEVTGTPYVTMRYVAGPTLADLVEGGGATPRRALAILEQIALALDYAHSQGVVHGDVKPDNVFLEDEDRVTVTDFGVARVRGTSPQAASWSALGTPDYMSPEQARGSEPGPASDLYSLGVVAYELLVGRRPFSAENPLALVYAHAYSPPTPPDALRPSLSSGVAQVLLRSLAKDPTGRFASASEFIAALRREMRS